MTRNEDPVTVIRGFARGLAQWPVVAAAWAIHCALLLYVFLSRFPIGQLGLGETTLVALGLVGFVGLEAALLAVLVGALEALRPRGALAAAIDLLKSLGIALVLVVLVISTLKFITTSIHLKVTDVWFGYTNFRQILQEAQLAELIALLALPTAGLVVAIGLWIGFRRHRARPRELPVGRFLVPVGACALLLAIGGLFSVVLPQVLAGVVPEGHWAVLQRSHSRFLNIADTPAARNSERGIVRYQPGDAGTGWNVVLVMLESVPWKRTFSSPEGRAGVMPNLERLAAESVIFERAYAVSTHSDYAQMAILSSLYPRKYEHHDYYLDIDYPRTLIWDALQAAGYTTSLFSCQNERWGNMLAFLETPGLDVLRHSLHWPDAERKGSGLESKVYEQTPIEEWQRWRRERVDGPYFTYLNFQSNHFPYEVPADAPTPYRPFELDFAASFLRYPIGKVDVMQNRFDNALHHADRKIGEIIEFLDEIGDWDSTALIVVSDHGEAFYEHGQPTHGTSLYEEQVRSFWMVRVPGGSGRRIEQPVSLLDVAPTLLELLGLPAHRNFQGRGDLLEPSYDGSERPLFFTIQGLTQEDGVLLGDEKLILNWDHRSKALFDLAEDPDEMSNLADAHPERLQEMEQVLAGFLQSQLAYYRERLWTRGLYPSALP